jgi:signal transduction histidine kinase
MAQRERAAPRVEVRESGSGSLPRLMGGAPDKLELFWGLLSIRRSESGDEKISVFWGLLELRTRRRREIEPGAGAAQQRTEERIESVRATAVFGSLGVGFGMLAMMSDAGFWSGVFGVLGTLLLALAGGQLLVAFADRFRPQFLGEEVDRERARNRTLQGRHSRDIQELTASIAHEIRNPITAAKSLVQQMGEDPNAQDNVEYASVALEELQRVERSVSHLLRFARDEDVSLHQIRLADVVEGALGVLSERADKEGAELRYEVDSEGELEGDPEQLRRVVLNLIGNSLDALRDAKAEAPRVDVQLGDDLSGSEVWLRVRDNGPGIPEDERERIFRPFHTSKDSGTGLGLAITKKVVEAHEGTIEVNEAPGGGAEFLVTLPKHRG